MFSPGTEGKTEGWGKKEKETEFKWAETAWERGNWTNTEWLEINSLDAQTYKHRHMHINTHAQVLVCAQYSMQTPHWYTLVCCNYVCTCVHVCASMFATIQHATHYTRHATQYTQMLHTMPTCNWFSLCRICLKTQLYVFICSRHNHSETPHISHENSRNHTVLENICMWCCTHTPTRKGLFPHACHGATAIKCHIRVTDDLRCHNPKVGVYVLFQIEEQWDTNPYEHSRTKLSLWSLWVCERIFSK